jgi:hypothetical protein
LPEKRKGEKKLVRAIVVLIRNTTWRCGKLERSIVKHLHSRHTLFGKSEMPVNDILNNFNVTGKKKSEFLDALRRLERRNIIRILSPIS